MKYADKEAEKAAPCPPGPPLDRLKWMLNHLHPEAIDLLTAELQALNDRVAELEARCL